MFFYKYTQTHTIKHNNLFINKRVKKVLKLIYGSPLTAHSLFYQLVDQNEEKTVKNEYIQPGAGIDLEFETDGNKLLTLQITVVVFCFDDI